MTPQEYENELRELRERLEKLEAEKIEEPRSKQWKPEFDGVYHFVDSYGDCENSRWGDGNYHEFRYLTGNCFKTREEAEEYKKQIEYTAKYKNYIEEHSNPIDWKSRNQQKYNACYSTYDEEIYFENSAYACCQGVIYASNEQIVKDAIKEIGEDNFKKYVLGVN